MKRFGTVIAFQGLPPSEFRIWPYGVVRFEWDDGLKLDLLFTPEDAQEVVRRAKLRQVSNELPIDYDHRTEMPVDNGPIPAAGWFSVEARGDEERAEAIRKAREKLIARRIVQRMKAQSPSRAAWWQNEWFWRAVALAAGLALALLGQQVKIP